MIFIIHGSKTLLMQDNDGQIKEPYSLSAGLDYPGVGPEHSYWKVSGRVRYTTCRDVEALSAFDTLARSEGILAALESCHAVAQALKAAAVCTPDEIVVVNLSGRGDKDVAEIARLRGEAGV